MSDFSSHDWLKGEEQLGGMIAHVRKNPSLSNEDKQAFRSELIVHLVYEDLQKNGLPGSPEESELLDTNEAAIADHFCERYDARFALSVTSNGVRDLFFYLASSPSETQISSDLETLPLSVDYDFGVRKGSDWSIYDYALSGSGNDGNRERRPWWKRLFGVR